MRVAELEGEVLDLWVARAEAYEFTDDPQRIGEAMLGERPACILRGHDGRLIRAVDGGGDGHWEPSASWAQGGPIIERERVMIVPAGYNGDPEHEWMAGDEECWTKFRQPRWRGPTPLVAAMRAFVSRKFGDEVEDLPDDTN